MAQYDLLDNLVLTEEVLIDRNPTSPLPDWQYLAGDDSEAMAIQVTRVDGGGAGRNIIAYSHVGVKTGPDYFPLILAGTRAEIPAEVLVFYQRPMIVTKEFQAVYGDTLLLIPQVWLAPQFGRAFLRFYRGEF
jgi:hypothetical protein